MDGAGLARQQAVWMSKLDAGAMQFSQHTPGAQLPSSSSCGAIYALTLRELNQKHIPAVVVMHFWLWKFRER